MQRVSTLDAAPEPARVALDVRRTPAQALLALRDDRLPVALVGRWAGGGALVTAEPLRVVSGPDACFDVLDEQPATPTAAHDAIGGGWFGQLGFGLAHSVEQLPAGPPRPAPTATSTLAYYDHLLRLDAGGRWWFEALVTEARREALEERLALLRERLAGPPAAPRRWTVEDLTPRAPGYAGHRAAVAACRERIAAGEIFQANLCMRFEGRMRGCAIDAFAHACTHLEPAYGAYLGVPGAPVLSLSPELFLQRRGRAVRTAPIKGTVARAGEPCAARRARERLLRSTKDAAEHVMIVDLMRNDLGRVCEFGTVEAIGAPRAEAHPGVWHLVGDVRGTLREGVGDGELLRATFPPGSVTGAPKVQALKVIAALEATTREAYTGAIGYASPVGGLELNVAIRTFETLGEHIWLGAGGGIVADSDPDEEVREVWRKAAPLARAVGAELAPPAPSKAPPAPPPPVPDGLRPRAAAGVLETLAARDGQPVRLDAHLVRLAASAAALWGAVPPPDLRERVLTAAASAVARPARLRVHAEPEAGGVRWSVDVGDAQAPPDAAPITLVPVVVPGGLGAHKWADRRLVQAAAPGACALLCDLDGQVLEAGWANVWLLEGATLVTPPADGRILPGVTRAAALVALPALGLRGAEEPFGVDRLRAADAVLLTSSVRLVTLATLLPAPPPSREAAALGERLRAALAAG